MFSFCPVCRLDMAVRHITVRGLCPDSVFNSAYTLTMTREGRARFLGHYTSSIQFDADTQLWRWSDMKQPSSLATRTGNLGTLGTMNRLHFAQCPAKNIMNNIIIYNLN